MEKMEGRNGFYVFPDKIGHVALIESMGSDDGSGYPIVDALTPPGERQ